MSATKRFLSGSAAAWVKIGVTIVSQIALVPIFLSHWTIEQYGCWLVIVSITGLTSLFSIAHQTYLEYEFLKIGDKKTQSLALLFYSSLPFAILLCFLELVFIVASVWFGFLNAMFDAKHNLSPSLLNEVFWSLIITSFTWLLVTSVGGIGGRLVSPLGYYPRFAWWGVLLTLSTTIASVIAVYHGAGVLTATIAVSIVNCIVNIPIHIDIWRLCKKHQILPIKPDWLLGAKVAIQSFALVVGSVIDNLRNQGIRVFLSAIVGLNQMTVFSTTRTISNVSLQGIGTVSSPAMPELMRYLRERDQLRMQSVMGVLLFLTVILLAPIMLVLQLIMPDIFLLWTRGKLPFDGILFAIFSISLLFNAYARSASAVIQGNNLVKIQLIMSTLQGAVAISGIVLLSNFYGIHGAAVALLIAEIIGDVMVIYFATQWLNQNNMRLPLGLFVLALVSIFMASAGILVMAWWPNLKLSSFVVSLFLCLLILVLFVRKLPQVAVDKFKVFLRKFTSREIHLFANLKSKGNGRLKDTYSILLYCVLDKQGGIETHIKSLAKVLTNAGADVTVAAKWVKTPQEYEAYFKSTGVRLVYPKLATKIATLGLPKKVTTLILNLLAVVTFRFQLKPASFDLVSVNATGFFGERLRRYVKPRSGQLTYHEHQTIHNLQHVSLKTIDMFNRMSFVSVNASLDYQKVVTLLNDKSKAYILPALASAESKLPELAKKTRGKLFSVAFVGNVGATEKGAHKLLHLWRLNNIQDMSLTFYGPNPESLGDISDVPQVKVAGSFSPKDIALVFASIDLLVHPADNESLGLVLIEAMAHGVPFVATHVGGMIDIALNNPSVLTVNNTQEAIYLGIMQMRKRIENGEIDSNALQAQYENKWSAKVLGEQWVQRYIGHAVIS